MFEIFTKQTGSRTEDALRRMIGGGIFNFLEDFGKAGVDSLSQATPKDSGKTAASWYYTVSLKGNNVGIQWYNDNVNDGVLIAILLQYGHGTGTGGYVVGRDYINPALDGIFREVADRLIEEVTR